MTVPLTEYPISVSFMGTKQYWGRKGDMKHVFPNVNVEHLLDPKTAIPHIPPNTSSYSLNKTHLGHVFLCWNQKNTWGLLILVVHLFLVYVSLWCFFHQKNPDEETNQQVADVKRGLELLKIRSEDGERPGGKTFPGPDPPMVATGLSLLMEVVETDDSRGK